MSRQFFQYYLLPQLLLIFSVPAFSMEDTDSSTADVSDSVPTDAAQETAKDDASVQYAENVTSDEVPAEGEADAADNTEPNTGTPASIIRALSQVTQSDFVRPWAHVQVWGTVWDADVNAQADPAGYGDPEADPGFSIPRARIGVDGRIPMTWMPPGHQIFYGVSAGIATPYDAISPALDGIHIVDAHMGWIADTSIGPSQLQLGIQKVPFSRDGLMSSKDLLFQERAVGTEWLAPGRDVGLSGSQTWKFSEENDLQLKLSAGVFNGNDDPLGDHDAGLLTATRLEFSMGDTYKTWSVDKTHAFGLGFAFLHNDSLNIVNNTFHGDMLARFSLVSLHLEYTHALLAPGNTEIASPLVLEDTIQRSASAQLSVWIPIKEAHGIEIGSRFAVIDDASHLENGGDVGILHAGLTWRNPVPGLDIGLGYIARLEREENGFPNDTVRIWTQIRPMR